jgi:hypothetical protein
MRQRTAVQRRWRRGAGAVVVVVVTALVVAASAFAYFTTFGGGAGSGSAADAQPVTVSPGSPTGQLYPGGQADVAVEISNPNPFPVHVGSLALDTGSGTGGFGVGAGHAGCDPAALGFTTQTASGAGWTIPPKAGAVDGLLAIDLSDAIQMGAGAADACQGATFVVHLSVGP